MKTELLELHLVQLKSQLRIEQIKNTFNSSQRESATQETICFDLKLQITEVEKQLSELQKSNEYKLEKCNEHIKQSLNFILYPQELQINTILTEIKGHSYDLPIEVAAYFELMLNCLKDVNYLISQPRTISEIKEKNAKIKSALKQIFE